jgi:hypothetical protein
VANDAVHAVLRSLTEYERRHFGLSPLESLEFEIVSPSNAVALGTPAEDVVRVRASYWCQRDKDDYGRHGKMARTYRSHAVDIPVRTLLLKSASSRGYVVELVASWMRYAAICVVPFRKPKGYRMLYRRVVVVERPRKKWRKLSRAA